MRMHVCILKFYQYMLVNMWDFRLRYEQFNMLRNAFTRRRKPSNLYRFLFFKKPDLCPKQHNKSFRCLPEQVQVRCMQESPKCIEGPCMSVSVSGCLRRILNVFPFNSILAVVLWLVHATFIFETCLAYNNRVPQWACLPILAVGKHTTSFACEV